MRGIVPLGSLSLGEGRVMPGPSWGRLINIMFFGKDKEQEILRLFGKGDSRAMDLLYAEYSDYLNAVCARYVPNCDDRHDVLQEAFIKIFTRIDTFRYQGRGSLRAWASRIVVNEALGFLRRQHPEQESADDPADLSIADEEPQPDGIPPEALSEMIASLPPGYRAVLNLYAIEGRSHKEIASILGISPDTSASQFHRACNRLARMITDYKRKEDIA